MPLTWDRQGRIWFYLPDFPYCGICQNFAAGRSASGRADLHPMGRKWFLAVSGNNEDGFILTSWKEQ